VNPQAPTYRKRRYQSTRGGIGGLKAEAGKAEGRNPAPSVFSQVPTFSLFALVAHLEDQIEAKTQEKNIRHPAGDRRC
jgi:hypothetical protein